MSHPKAYSPEEGYQYQILYRNTKYDRSYEHLDYATDRADMQYMMNEYRLAYQGHGGEFKIIPLPKKYWSTPKPQKEKNEYPAGYMQNRGASY